MNKRILGVCLVVLLLLVFLLFWQNRQLTAKVDLLEQNQRELTQKLQDLDDRLVQLNQQFLNHFYANTLILQDEQQQGQSAHITP